MFAKETLEEIERWKQHIHSPHYQLDWRWIKRFRQLDAYDAYWWWAYAGPFTQEEQQQWEQLLKLLLDEETKKQLGNILVQSREREITMALAEQREPQLWYPALDSDEVRQRIAGFLYLDEEIRTQEPNAIVRRLYHDMIADEVAFLRMFEATSTEDSEQFLACSQALYPAPTDEEMQEAVAYVKQSVVQGLVREDTREIAQHVLHLIEQQLHLPFDTTSLQGVFEPSRPSPSGSPTMVSAQAAKRFFETVLRTSGYEEWRVVLEHQGAARVESGLRCIFLPDTHFSLGRLRRLFAHELVGHVTRSIAGEHSLLGLLAIGTKNYAPTEEGLALYHERQVAALHGQTIDNVDLWELTLTVGLACGVMTPPQTFSSLFTFLEAFYLLRRVLKRLDKDRQVAQQRARNGAIGSCLRVFRGVPDTRQSGICATRDGIYLRGLRLIEQVAAQDASMLDRLMVGKTALEYLPDLLA